MHSFMRSQSVSRWIHQGSSWIHLASCANENIDKSKNERKVGLLIQQSGSLVILVCTKRMVLWLSGLVGRPKQGDINVELYSHI
jgi:hypothetical protein